MIVGVNHFPIYGENFPQSHLIIIREYPKTILKYYHILRYLNNFNTFQYPYNQA